MIVSASFLKLLWHLTNRYHAIERYTGSFANSPKRLLPPCHPLWTRFSQCGLHIGGRSTPNVDLYNTYLHVNSYPRCGTTKGGMSSTLGVNPLCGPQQGTPIVVHNRDIPNVLPMWRFFALPTNPQCGAYFSIGCSTPQRLSSHIFYVTTRFLLMTSRASPLYCLLSSRYISLLYRV
jgi:hypothetical protein